MLTGFWRMSDGGLSSIADFKNGVFDHAEGRNSNIPFDFLQVDRNPRLRAGRWRTLVGFLDHDI